MASLLIVLFFGSLEFGLMLRARSNLTDATREAARTAAAQPREDGFQNSALAVINGSSRNTGEGSIQYVTIYRADPANDGRPVFGQDFETCMTDCWRYEYVPGIGLQEQFGPTWVADTQKACGDLVNHDWVGVYVRTTHSWVTGFFGSDRTLTDFTVMRLEPVPRDEKCR